MIARSALIIAVIAAASACGNPSTPGASSETVTTPPTTSVTATPSACDELGGKVGPDQVCTVHTEKSGYTIDMSFPVTYPDQKALAGVLVKQRDQFVKAVEEPPVRDVPKALDVTATTYRSATPATESVVLEEYVNVGGAHPETYYDALTYDLATKTPVTFATLFKPSSDPVAVLDPLVKAQWQKLLDGEPVQDNSIGADMYANFALTDDAVIFFIGQGLWEYEAVGPQQFSIPRSQLASILA
ncbi:esterase [Mycolicibacterium sp.]|uniref:esterase n=1 Tax=Mycolicibacterium sp. TaxID=2320850 RepID=UPI001A2E4E3A|nr:esterase [Mycolicibacterium sp.]MBJ7339330.1 DUF3298 domain-containing protein [Mycolicibacterium sp.]